MSTPFRPAPPAYFGRPLPTPTRRELALRSWKIARTFTPRLGPVALRQLRGARTGSVDVAAFGQPLRESFERVGGTFVKFGQIIASSPGLFGDELANEFRSCLDTGPIVPFEEVRDIVEVELGRKLEEVFASFDTTPIGRASIAVVHRATLLDGTPVAVKVLRPGIEHLVATDLDVMQPLFEVVVRQTGAQIAGATLQQLDGLRTQIGEELDLRNEVRALQHFRELAADAGLDNIVVPAPFPELSGRDVLTMEFLDGVPIDDLSQIEALSLDPAPLIDQLIRGFFTMTVRWGTFHGDVHAGNVMLLRDGRIGVIDFGIVGRLDAATHRFFVRLLAAVLGEEEAWRDVTDFVIANYGDELRQAVAMNDDELAAFMRMMIEPLLLKPFGEVSFADMMMTLQVRVAEANGVNWQHRSWKELFRRIRMQRRLHRLAMAGGGLMSEFDRANFLLAKQLMYFERYGRLYLQDRPILSEREFLQGLIDDLPANEPLS